MVNKYFTVWKLLIDRYQNFVRIINIPHIPIQTFLTGEWRERELIFERARE